MADRQEVGSEGYSEARITRPIYKKRYYTPDGREIWATPLMREWRQINPETKKIVQEGVRDANYDKGWLDTPPENPKIYCGNCDRWHDTEEEVEKCKAERKKRILPYMNKGDKLAAKLRGERPDTQIDPANLIEKDQEIQELKDELAEIKSLLSQLVPKK